MCNCFITLLYWKWSYVIFPVKTIQIQHQCEEVLPLTNIHKKSLLKVKRMCVSPLEISEVCQWENL